MEEREGGRERGRKGGSEERRKEKGGRLEGKEGGANTIVVTCSTNILR